MTLISLSRIEKSFGDRTIFSEVSLRVAENDRIGVIGDNGAGKTTLMKICTGEDVADRGNLSTRRDLTIAWTNQIPILEPELSLLQCAQASFSELDQMEAELRRLEHEMAENPDDRRLHDRHEHVHVAFEVAGGYRRDQTVEKTLFGLGFSAGDFAKPIANLSGGQRARIALARVMLRPAELLILDEPTNHLDLEGLAFLESWLTARKGAFLVVSHDRRFLDLVCTSIVDVESGKVTRYSGNFTACRKQKELTFKSTLRAYKKQEDLIVKERAFIRKHIGSRRTAEAKGRQKRLERIERLVRPRRKAASMKLELGKKARGLEGQTLIEATDVSFSWPGGVELFHHQSFRIFYGDRIGMVGRNGVGKSTLFELICAERSPTSGKIERAVKLQIARFTQEMEDLPQAGNVLMSLQALVPDWTEGECRAHLARFQFLGEDIEKAVATLSGGEKRRLCLARLVTSHFDLLLLDEPTNHLDISTRESLEESLKATKMTIVAISHDRHFLAEVATRIFELESDYMRIHECGMEEFEEKKKIELRELARRRRGEGQGKKRSSARAGKDEVAKSASDKIRNPYAFARLEERIFSLEAKLLTIRESLADQAIWHEPESMKELGKQQEALATELNELMEQWENW